MESIVYLTLTQAKANLSLVLEIVSNLEIVKDDYILWHETFHSVTNAIESIEDAMSNVEMEIDRPF